MIVIKNELVVAADATAATDDSEVPVMVVATMNESVVVVERLFDDGHVVLPRPMLIS